MQLISRTRMLAAPAILLAALVAAPATADESSDIQQVGHCCEPTCGCDTCDDGCCGTCNSGCCDDGCCCESDCCRKCCVATVETEKVEKHCWKVECKEICVPKVVMPWQEGGSGLTLFSFLKKGKCHGCGDTCCSDACGNGCDSCCSNGCCMKPRCGEVKCVRDIKKEKYETEKCVCKWEIRRLPPCCDSECCHGGNGCCGDGGCCSDSCCGDACCDPSCGASASQPSDQIQLTGLELPTTAASGAETDDDDNRPEQPTAGEAEQPAVSTAKTSWLQRLMWGK